MPKETFRPKNVTFIDDLMNLEEMEPQRPVQVFQRSLQRSLERGPQRSLERPVEGSLIDFDERIRKMNCVDIAEHVRVCPICSKFYSNTDKNFYLIVIFVLCVVCLILFNRVINDKR